MNHNRYEYQPRIPSEEELLKLKSEQVIDDLVDRTRAGLTNTAEQLPERRLQDQVYPAGLSVYTLEDFQDIEVSNRAIREVNHIWQRTRPVPKSAMQYHHARDTQNVDQHASGSNIGILHSIEWPADDSTPRPNNNEILSEDQDRAHENIIREVGKAAMTVAGGESRSIVAVVDANVLTQSRENAQAITDFFRARAKELRKLDKDGTLWSSKMILIKNPPFPADTREVQNALLDVFRDSLREDEWLAADAFPAGVSRDQAYPVEAITAIRDDNTIIAPKIQVENSTIQVELGSDVVIHTGVTESSDKTKH